MLADADGIACAFRLTENEIFLRSLEKRNRSKSIHCPAPQQTTAPDPSSNMPPRSYSPLYRQLRSVAPDDYQRIIREYEEREREIGHLHTGEYFELTVAYVDALFQTGAYRRHQLVVDHVLHYCIEHNFRTLPDDDRDIFHHMLLRKAGKARP